MLTQLREMNQTQPFNILRTEFHRNLEVTFVDTEPEAGQRNYGSENCQNLSHCDRVFVCLSVVEAVANEKVPPSPLTNKTIGRICGKVYQTRIKRADSFVSLLEVNIVPPNAFTEQQSSNKMIDVSYGCFLVAVISLPNRRDLIYEPLTNYSVLASGNKCFEIANQRCLQRPYHIISASKMLQNYKLLMVCQNGWLLVVSHPYSPRSSMALVTCGQYVAIGANEKLHFAHFKCFNKICQGFSAKSNNYLPTLCEAMCKGEGNFVRYGAILSGWFESTSSTTRAGGGCTFIGELVHTKNLQFGHIQERLNLINCLDNESVWPELPKLENDGENEHVNEQQNEVSKKIEAMNIEDNHPYRTESKHHDSTISTKMMISVEGNDHYHNVDGQRSQYELFGHQQSMMAFHQPQKFGEDLVCYAGGSGRHEAYDQNVLSTNVPHFSLSWPSSIAYVHRNWSCYYHSCEVYPTVAHFYNGGDCFPTYRYVINYPLTTYFQQ